MLLSLLECWVELKIRSSRRRKCRSKVLNVLGCVGYGDGEACVLLDLSC